MCDRATKRRKHCFMVKRIVALFIFAAFVCACEEADRSHGTEPAAESPGTVERRSSKQAAVAAKDSPDSLGVRELEEAMVEADYGGRIERSRPGVISRYDKIVRKYARRYLFDWRLISAQIYAESTFRHTARSSLGALGLMQIMPSTARWLEEKVTKDAAELKGASELLLKPEVNIHLGCYYNAMLLSRIQHAESSEEQYKMMFTAYNAGFGNLSKARRRSSSPGNWEGIKPYLPREAQHYVPKIYEKYEIYKQWAALMPY